MLKELAQYLQSLSTVETERKSDERYPSDIVSVPSGRSLTSLENHQKAPNRISSSFTNALGALRTAGLLEVLAITDAGSKLIGPGAGEKPTGGQLREWARPKLSKAENAVLDVMIYAEGRRLSDEEIGATAGYSTSSSSFTNALGHLRSIGAAVGYAKNGGTRAAEVFFA